MKTLETPQDKNIYCITCEAIIQDVCRLLTPSESMWFRKSVSEIVEYDGHKVLERFLRLYRCGLFASKFENPKWQTLEENPDI